MKVAVANRLVTPSHRFKAPLRVRIWKSAIPEQRAESENLPERRIFFAADSLLHIGTIVEILLRMPEEITGEPATDWLCTGQGVRMESVNSAQGKVGVLVQFDCYQMLQPSDLGRK